MMISNEEATTINKTLCPINQRLYFLPQYLGNVHQEFQNRIYDFARQFIEGYDGGYWDFYHLSNDGYMMVWDENSHFTFNSLNGSQDKVDAETASIAINLMVLSNLSFALQTDTELLHKVVNGFHALREFALQHPHSETILKLID